MERQRTSDSGLTANLSHLALACAQCLVLAYSTGELEGARQSLYVPETSTLRLSLLGALFFNGALAFMMNVVSFNVSSQLSAFRFMLKLLALAGKQEGWQSHNGCSREY